MSKPPFSKRKQQAKHLPSPSQVFLTKKHTILAQLSVPEGEYTDLSPKGSIDAGIRDLIDELNHVSGLVTTSSCAGRICVFVEGRKAPFAGEGDGRGLVGVDERVGVEVVEGEEGDDGDERPSKQQMATVGGKGGGGHWLFVSHDPVGIHSTSGGAGTGVLEQIWELLRGDDPQDSNTPTIAPGKSAEAQPESRGQKGEARLVHLKFEPMILHILTSSLDHAQLILSCGLQAGFRESGAVNLVAPMSSGGSGEGHGGVMPMVGIRSMGIGFDSIIARQYDAVDNQAQGGEGGTVEMFVGKEGLEVLLETANERFVENSRRIGRFRDELKRVFGEHVAADEGEQTSGQEDAPSVHPSGWEESETRRARKKAEGLRIAEGMRRLKGQKLHADAVDIAPLALEGELG